LRNILNISNIPQDPSFKASLSQLEIFQCLLLYVGIADHVILFFLMQRVILLYCIPGNETVPIQTLTFSSRLFFGFVEGSFGVKFIQTDSTATISCRFLKKLPLEVFYHCNIPAQL